MKFLCVLCALILWATPADAQTTGVCGTNELLVNGVLPGGTSCIGPVPLPPGSVFTVEGTSTALVAIYEFSFCPCAPCIFGPGFGGRAPLLPASCLPVPFTACGGATNQSIDIDAFSAACAPFNIVLPMFTATTCAAGGLPNTVSVLGPIAGLPPGIPLSVQAFIIDTDCFSPDWKYSFGGIVKTQAYELLTTDGSKTL